MSKQIGWDHPVDGSDQWDGFNEPGIETFAGNPIYNLAREVNQNALDAGASDCVDVKIRLHQIETATIPDLEELKTNFEACYEASKTESPKAKVFFEIARDELNKTKIDVLEISDYNTHGMTGPSKNGTPFFAFMKAKGQSRKDSNTAAGSYGIGKFAPYSASKIRTIFVSTVFQDDSGEYQQYTQGKSILMSHDLNGKRKQGVGFWGVKKKCQHVVGISTIVPDWIQRTASKDELPRCKGTKLSVLCFDVAENWRECLAVSVAENFFGAITFNKLCVDVGGVHILNQDTIHTFLNDKHIRKLVEDQSNEPEQFDNSRSYLAALQDDSYVEEEESQMGGLGHVQVRILVQEGLPKRVCVLRNGMFISDSLDRLKSFSDFKEFVAVVRCQSDAGNELLRDMEPPRHNDFEPERLPTKKEQKIGTRALKELAKWIRDMLKRHAKDPVSEVTEIDELKEFFFEEGEDGSGHGTEDINPYGEVLIRAKPIKMKTYSTIKSVEGGEGGDGEAAEGGGGGAGAGGGDGQGGTGNGTGGTTGGLQKSLIEVTNVRTILAGGRNRKVAFTPVTSGGILLRLMEAGADSDYDISIVATDVGEIKKGGVLLEVTAERRYNLNVELSHDFSGAIKVVAYEV